MLEEENEGAWNSSECELAWLVVCFPLKNVWEERVEIKSPIKRLSRDSIFSVGGKRERKERKWGKKRRVRHVKK